MYGAVIQKIRKDLGMNMRDFGKLVGLSFSYVAMLEKEKSYKGKEKLFPTLDTLKQICDATNYSLRTFLEEAGYLEPLSPLQSLCGSLTKSQQEDVFPHVERVLKKYIR